MKLFCILFLNLLGLYSFAQSLDKNKNELISDNFQDITFEKDKLVLTEEGTKVLKHIESNFDLIDKSKFDLHFEVIPSENESDERIAYKRVSVVLNYLKDNYQIDSSNFKIVFHESISIDALIRFSLR